MLNFIWVIIGTKQWNRKELKKNLKVEQNTFNIRLEGTGSQPGANGLLRGPRDIQQRATGHWTKKSFFFWSLM